MNATSLVVLALSVSFPPPAARSVQEDKKENSAAKQIEAELIGEHRQMLITMLSIEIDELVEVLKLEPKQAARLKLAGKGAATKAVEKYRTNIVRVAENHLREHPIFLLNGRRIVVGKKPKAEEPAEPDEPGDAEDRVDAGLPKVSLSVTESGTSINVRRNNGSMGTGFGGGIRHLKSQDVWTKAYGQVVTADQQKVYDGFRKKKRRDQLRKMILAMMVLELRLTDPQEEQVDKWLDQAFIKKPPQDAAFNNGLWIVRRAAQAMDFGGLKGVLTPEQLKVWTARKDSL